MVQAHALVPARRNKSHARMLRRSGLPFIFKSAIKSRARTSQNAARAKRRAQHLKRWSRNPFSVSLELTRLVWEDQSNLAAGTAPPLHFPSLRFSDGWTVKCSSHFSGLIPSRLSKYSRLKPTTLLDFGSLQNMPCSVHQDFPAASGVEAMLED